MNRNDFLNMIGSGVPVDRLLTAEISDLVTIFPYFQSAHLLLLKGMQSNSDVKFQNQLRNSAIHIADREVLYYLLNATVTLVNAGGESNKEYISEGKNTSVDTQQTVIESAKNSDYLISEIEKDSEELNPEDNDRPENESDNHSVLISEVTDIVGRGNIFRR